MTISASLRNKILEERGRMPASEIAQRYRVSETTIYKIWHEYGGTYKPPELRNPTYRAFYRAMWRFEHPPYNSIRPLFIRDPEEEAIIDVIGYYQEHGPEILDVLKEHYDPDELPE